MLFNAITWNVDPEIFSLGQLSIRWYGLLFASAFLSGYIVFTRYLTTERLNSEMLDQLLIYVAVGTVLGARLGHCFFYEPDYFLKNPGDSENLERRAGQSRCGHWYITRPVALYPKT